MSAIVLAWEFPVLRHSLWPTNIRYMGLSENSVSLISQKISLRLVVPPSCICWFIIPMKTNRSFPRIRPSYWSDVHQLNAHDFRGTNRSLSPCHPHGMALTGHPSSGRCTRAVHNISPTSRGSLAGSQVRKLIQSL